MLISFLHLASTMHAWGSRDALDRMGRNLWSWQWPCPHFALTFWLYGFKLKNKKCTATLVRQMVAVTRTHTSTLMKWTRRMSSKSMMPYSGLWTPLRLTKGGPARSFGWSHASTHTHTPVGTWVQRIVPRFPPLSACFISRGIPLCMSGSFTAVRAYDELWVTSRPFIHVHKKCGILKDDTRTNPSLTFSC